MLTQAEGEQPRIAVVFRVAGKSTREDKKASCHPNVAVYWQSFAWVYTGSSVIWANITLAQSVNDLDGFAIFQSSCTNDRRFENCSCGSD